MVAVRHLGFILRMRGTPCDVFFVMFTMSCTRYSRNVAEYVNNAYITTTVQLWFRSVQ